MSNFTEDVDYSTSPNGTNGFDSNGGVQCDPPTGINCLIIGAGVGGLTAAIECHRKGHTVRVWERSESAVAGGKGTIIASVKSRKLSQA